MLNLFARTSRRAACSAPSICIRSASRSVKAAPAPVPPSPRAPRVRLDSLAHLEPAAHRLAFRSLPYAAPAHLIAPSSSHFSHHAGPFFSLRCYPSVPRSPSAAPTPRKRAKAKDSPLPVPFLRGRTAHSPFAASPFLSAAELRASLARHADHSKGFTMDLTLLASKKRVHKSAVIRERCKRRVREAVRLVVVRGARAAKEGEEGAVGGLVLREEDVRETGSRKWLAAGHHYIMSISSLEVYRMPLPVLVEQVRTALRAVRRKAEAAALARQLADIELSPRALQVEEPATDAKKG
ncbi:hypothetical protein JCM10449v2_001102 [Rhodotorula kratochvilovae]